MTLPALTEAQFMEQVAQLAELRGWSWAHFRPARTAKGWRTPVSGPLGKGWPDLFLIRHRDQKFMGVELKVDGGRQTSEQEEVEIQFVLANIPFYVWRPTDWELIERVLA
jgi:VRR-NUC domain-containing protein